MQQKLRSCFYKNGSVGIGHQQELNLISHQTSQHKFPTEFMKESHVTNQANTSATASIHLDIDIFTRPNISSAEVTISVQSTSEISERRTLAGSGDVAIC